MDTPVPFDGKIVVAKQGPYARATFVPTNGTGRHVVRAHRTLPASQRPPLNPAPFVPRETRDKEAIRVLAAKCGFVPPRNLEEATYPEEWLPEIHNPVGGRRIA